MLKKKHKTLTELVVRHYFQGRYAPEVERDAQLWLTDEQDESLKSQAMEELWENLHVASTPSVQQSFRIVSEKLGLPAERPAQAPVVSLRRRLIRVAAALVPLLVIAGALYLMKPRQQTAEIAWVEFSVPYGERAELELPDGSRLSVNAGSTVLYPEGFQGDERLVKLNGEALFDVAADAEKPFVVQTENLTVRVVGTVFNVASYHESDSELVTVIQGTVEVRAESGGENFRLHPGDQLILSKADGSISQERVQPEKAAVWTQGHLVFSDATFLDMLSMIEKHYNTPVHLDGEAASADRYSLKFVHGETVHEVMRILEYLIGGFVYHIGEDGIHIYPD